MSDFILYDLLMLEKVIPTIPAFYNHMLDGMTITNKIIESIDIFRPPSDLAYLNNINLFQVNLSRDNIFYDNEYWNFWYETHRTYTNHNIWNFLNLNVKIKAWSGDFWINVYPINIEAPLWLSSDISYFRPKFHYVPKYLHDITYLDERRFKHHDYTNDIYVCSTLFWQQYLHTQTVPSGFFFFWYENYGSVEAGIKFSLTYWYQIWYPDFEYTSTLTPTVINMLSYSLTDYMYYCNELTKMIFDIEKVVVRHSE